MESVGQEFTRHLLALQPASNIDEQVLTDLVNVLVAKSKAQVMGAFSEMSSDQQAHDFHMQLKVYADNLELTTKATRG